MSADDNPDARARSHVALRAWFEAALPVYNNIPQDQRPTASGFPRHPSVVYTETDRLYEVFLGVAGWRTCDLAGDVLFDEVLAWEKAARNDLNGALQGFVDYDSPEPLTPRRHARLARQVVTDAAARLADLAELNTLRAHRDSTIRSLMRDFRGESEYAYLAAVGAAFESEPGSEHLVAHAKSLRRFMEWAYGPDSDEVPELVTR